MIRTHPVYRFISFALALTLFFSFATVSCVKAEEIIRWSKEETEEALTFLHNLPAEIIGLPEDASSYVFSYQEEELDYWFHRVSINIASEENDYLLAKDFSALYRIEEEIPYLVYGSAQPMLDYERTVYIERNFATPEENDLGIVGMDAPIIYDTPLVTIDCAFPLIINGSGYLQASLPAELPYRIDQIRSSQPDIISVADDGQLRVHKPGSTKIDCLLHVDDASKPMTLVLDVSEPSIFLSVPDYLYVGDEGEVVAEIFGIDPAPPVSLSVSDSKVLALNDRSYTALQSGSVTVRAAAEGYETMEATVLVVQLDDEEEEEVEEDEPNVVLIAATAAIVITAVYLIYRGQSKSK